MWLLGENAEPAEQGSLPVGMVAWLDTELPPVDVVGQRPLPWEVLTGDELNALGTINYGPGDIGIDDGYAIPASDGSDGQTCGCDGGAGDALQDLRAEAAKVTGKIKDQNWTTQEYGAILFEKPGEDLTHGQITPGSSREWIPSAENMTGIKSDLWIRGMIHNHPPNTIQGDSRYPSSADWDSFNSLVMRVAAAGGDASAMRLYIIAADGKIYEYRPGDEATKALGEVIDANAAAC